MLTAVCLTIALASLGLCCFCAYWVGYTRRVRESEAYALGRAEGIRLGRAEGNRERDELGDRVDEATAEYVATLSQLVGIARERDELRERLAELTTAVGTAYEEARALSDEVSR